MRFETPEQEQAFAEIGGWLRATFLNVKTLATAPVYRVSVGDVTVHVMVHPWPNMTDAVIQMVAYVVLDPGGDTDLADYLLRENETFRFGGFAIDADGDISFRYSVMASMTTKHSLRRAVEAVAFEAGRNHAPIVERWGGTPGIEWTPTA